eukprot:TRINITY_DN23711_c0_g1_i1.p1 TRINITY_DN23711_c0_g1~~TRINITY_DN23711_c0_g1_i1.p1  ORF type:complete len:800 (-),score=71.23 TRINITY_DN23711_c0_g1_i1:61-2460(-)
MRVEHEARPTRMSWLPRGKFLLILFVIPSAVLTNLLHLALMQRNPRRDLRRNVEYVPLLEQALLTRANLSTQFMGSKNPFPSPFCVDYNISTFCHSTLDTNPWLEVGLPATLMVNSVEIVNRLDCCGERLFPFELWAFPDAYSADHVVCNRITEARNVTNVTCSAWARRVRLVLPGLRTLHVSSLRVFFDALAGNISSPTPIISGDPRRPVAWRELHPYWALGAPLHIEPKQLEERFVTFEPWHGGFNNRRMSLELAFAIAFLSNRTLVLPPPAPLANLHWATAGFEDFFDINDMRRALPVLTYQQYRQRRPAAANSNFSLYPVEIEIRLLEPTEIGFYRFRTAGDAHGRDPRVWVMQGLQHEGARGLQWRTLSNITSYRSPAARNELTALFGFRSGPQKLQFLRWIIYAQQFPDPVDKRMPALQVSDFLLFDAFGAPISLMGSMAHTHSKSPKGEEASMMLDGDPFTKFFTYGDACASSPQGAAYCHAFLDERQGVNGSVSISDTNFLDAVYAFPDIPPQNTAQGIDLELFAVKRPVYSFKQSFPESATVWHFPQVLFMNWYTVLWVEDKQLYKRLFAEIRHNLHYDFRLLERATRIARFIGPSYLAVHVRRTDFQDQYPSEYLTADKVAGNIQNIVHTGEPVYIASEETSDEFYEPFYSTLSGHPIYRLRDVLFLFNDSEFYNSSGVIDENSSPDQLTEREQATPDYLYGCLEQLVCALSRVFVGTRLSTFSTYIVRMRGYMNTTNREEYFTDTTNYATGISEAHEPVAPYSWTHRSKRVLWQHEFPEAWISAPEPP